MYETINPALLDKFLHFSYYRSYWFGRFYDLSIVSFSYVCICCIYTYRTYIYEYVSTYKYITAVYTFLSYMTEIFLYEYAILHTNCMLFNVVITFNYINQIVADVDSIVEIWVKLSTYFSLTHVQYLVPLHIISYNCSIIHLPLLPFYLHNITSMAE